MRPERLATPVTDLSTHILADIGRLHRSFASGRTRPLAWRVAQLGAMDNMLVENEARFLDALHADLGQGVAEALTTELAFVRAEIKHLIAHVPKWSRREKVSTPLLMQPGRSYIARDPLGVVLVIGAWNLPVPVLLGPAVAAIAAGNAVVMKPSEVAAATAELIAELVPHYLDRDAILVVEGGVAETTALLDRPWGHIFYTGNATVGRIVAQAGARHLTPVTLELGGKSPAYVHRDADLKVTARRLAWAKWMNAGQVCVAPDYVLAHRDIADALVGAVGQALDEFFGADAATSPDYGRIVNERHHDRLTGYLDGHGGQVVRGGTHDRATLYLAPTIVRDPDPASALMTDEIFGPVMPVLTVDGPDAAIAFVAARPKPLVMHVFGKDSAVADRFEVEVLSGALLVNDAIVSHRNPELPFGGVGDSGYGAYHGRAGFETFSHRKAVLRRPTFLDAAMRYPPYTAKRLASLRRLTGI